MKRLIVISLLIGIGISCYAQYSSFQPQVFKPQKDDMTSLQRSLEILESRRVSAYEALSNLYNVFAQYAQLLHNDTETMTWFNNYRKKIIGSVDSFMNTNDYSNAYTCAIRCQGEVSSNLELAARVRTNKEYVEIKKGIISRSDLSQEEKDKWIKENPYKFVPIKSDDGTIIGGLLDIKQPPIIRQVNDK